MTFILTYTVQVIILYAQDFKLFDGDCWFKHSEAFKFRIALEIFVFTLVH